MTDLRWTPRLGAVPGDGETRFRVWAPAHETVSVVVGPGREAHEIALDPTGGGYFGGTVEGASPGDRYAYRLGGGGPYPDPVSRYQPDGVHGRSAIVDPSAFGWTDQHWRGVTADRLVIYELHVGTFTPGGTFRSAIERLPYLADLGVTAIELMPLADFPGTRNWGYDGVALFAPARCYGTPDDLRLLVDAAHHHGLGVLLDVVYNHVGPDGAYLFSFSPWYFTDLRPSPWGKGVNLDGPHAEHVRAFLIENALHWVHEYHVDGLRLDATHAMHDASEQHFLAELAARVRVSMPDRGVVVIAEDDRNLARMVGPVAAGGLGLDCVWADDLHHQLRRALAGDRDGYYADYTGTTDDIAATIRQGWFYTGQYSHYAGAPRGTDPVGIPRFRFVVCLQNHDQIGNRAHGGRLHHEADPASLRAATALLLTLPDTPLLFMGQEWAASSPFLYFTDHNDDLGRLVTAGRRREFERFEAFADPVARSLIPDPQAVTTFDASKLRWEEQGTPPHAAMLRLHRALLRLRRDEPALGTAAEAPRLAHAFGAETLVVVREAATVIAVIVVRLRGGGPVDLAALAPEIPEIDDGVWAVRLSTESAEFVDAPSPIEIELGSGAPRLTFARPGAVILTRTGAREPARS